jgi:hypothetical protein
MAIALAIVGGIAGTPGIARTPRHQSGKQFDAGQTTHRASPEADIAKTAGRAAMTSGAR